MMNFWINTNDSDGSIKVAFSDPGGADFHSKTVPAEQVSEFLAKVQECITHTTRYHEMFSYQWEG